MRFPRASIFCLLAVSAAVHAQSGGLLGFYSHPTHCATLIGGSDYVGESASADFARSLKDTMLSLQGDDRGLSTKAALNTVRELCHHKSDTRQAIAASLPVEVTK